MHFRPVYDVWSEFDLYTWICFAKTIVNTVVINRLVKEIFRFCKLCINIHSGSKVSFVGCCSSDGTGIHQSNRCNLSVGYLGTFTVREVTGRMTDTKSLIAWHISCSKTWTAESGTNSGTSLHKVSNAAIFNQFHKDRLGCRINTQGEFIGTNGLASKDICGITEVLITTTGTSGDHTLLNIQASIMDLVCQFKVNVIVVQADKRLFLYITKNVFQIGI